MWENDMKKILSVLMIILLLCSCGTKTEVNNKEESDLSIVTPLGAPVLAFYDQMENENYSRVAPNAINALWTGEESPDVLVCDLSSGIQAIKKGAEYKLAAIITFGNLYIASTGLDEDEEMGKDDRIVLFGNENALPSKIWHFLYGDEYDECLYYEPSATEAAACLASGMTSDGEEADYVMLAQPALFSALNKAVEKERDAKIYVDVQNEYSEKTGHEFVQAALFIKNSVSDEDAFEFLRKLEITVKAGIENPEHIRNCLSVYEGDEALVQYGFNPAVVLKVMEMKNASGNNAMGLGYKKAILIKDEIDEMLDVLGIEKTDEENYIK